MANPLGPMNFMLTSCVLLPFYTLQENQFAQIVGQYAPSVSS